VDSDALTDIKVTLDQYADTVAYGKTPHALHTSVMFLRDTVAAILDAVLAPEVLPESEAEQHRQDFKHRWR
jgi:hypothetical protein